MKEDQTKTEDKTAALELEALRAENAALKSEVKRLQSLAFSLEITCKTLASMTPTPSLVGQ